MACTLPELSNLDQALNRLQASTPREIGGCLGHRAGAVVGSVGRHCLRAPSSAADQLVFRDAALGQEALRLRVLDRVGQRPAGFLG